MTEHEFRTLRPGDIVAHESDGEAYVVTGNYGGRVTAVRTADLTNPREWALIRRPPEPPRRPDAHG